MQTDRQSLLLNNWRVWLACLAPALLGALLLVHPTAVRAQGGTLPPPNVTVQKVIVLPAGDHEAELRTIDAVPGAEIHFRLKLVNPDARPALVGLRDALPAGLTPANMDALRLQQGTVVKVAAGATKNLDFRARLLDTDTADLAIVNVASFVICPPPSAGACTWTGDAANVRASNAVTVTVRGRDLGDAPDSTNHFGLSMTAYPGVPAAFPTVFDPSSLPAGPVHGRPGPFHLGEGVSREVNADLGPDGDLIDNIVPAFDKANLDRFDDGLAPGGLVFSDCATTTVPVAVFIDPSAVSLLDQGVGYLNLWVDGNRNGAWGDVHQCSAGGSGGDPGLAFEHIVIDYPVDAAALGAGVHVVNVPTNRVSWPAALAADPAWLRVTLSEKPANKTLSAGGVAFGDGRGYDTPFRLGETEDYLWRSPEDPQNGPDLAIHKSGLIRPAAGVSGAVAGGAPTADRVVWLVEYNNQGSTAASGVQIVDDLAQAGDLGKLKIVSEPPLDFIRDGSTVTFTVGALAPFERRRILVTSSVLQQDAGAGYTNTATILADQDVDPTNNRAVATAASALRTPLIVEPGDGTTCDPQVTASGVAVPGSMVDLYVDGALAASVPTAGARWSTSVTLSDGMHTLYAVGRAGGITSQPSRTVNVTVDSSLSWSPLSLRFTNAHGISRRPVDASGRTDASGWTIHLRPGESYTVSVTLCCTAPGTAVQLVFSDTAPINLASSDGRLFQGSFTAPAEEYIRGSLALAVQCGSSQVTSAGGALIDPEGAVYDVKSGAPLPGSTVTCMAGQAGAAGAGTALVYDLWPADAYGQVNPQQTDSAGHFSFLTPPGSYRLDASRAGYQDFLSPDLAVVSDPVHYDVPLTPQVYQQPDHTVVMGESGFEPSYLTVKKGAVVAWVNMALQGHTATSQKLLDAAAVGGANFDSGLLLAGDQYKFSFDSAGVYTYSDQTNPANTGVIVVEDAVAGTGFKIYLPTVHN